MSIFAVVITLGILYGVYVKHINFVYNDLLEMKKFFARGDENPLSDLSKLSESDMTNVNRWQKQKFYLGQYPEWRWM